MHGTLIIEPDQAPMIMLYPGTPFCMLGCDRVHISDQNAEFILVVDPRLLHM